MGVGLDIQELGGFVERAHHQSAIPGPDRHIRDRIFIPTHIFIVRQVLVEHVKLTLYFHRVAVDGVFHLRGGIGIEMAEPAAEIGGRAHLPKEP